MDPIDIDNNPKESNLYFISGSHSVGINENKAIEYYSKVLDLNPEVVVVFNNRGNVYTFLGQYENALND